MNRETTQHSLQARRNIIHNEGGAFFECDWVRFVLIHYEVNVKLLQNTVPFELDLFDGKAYVSCVAFTSDNFNFAQKGLMQRLVMRPVRNHRYFNVRTYVNVGDQKGIYFLKEWISNKLCSIIGAWMYGLPCAHGRLNYSHQWEAPSLSGSLSGGHDEGTYRYRLCKNSGNELQGIEPGTLEEFLFERYVAFVEHKGTKKYFRIWHEPWRQADLDIEYLDDQLLPTLGPWGENPKFIKAHYSPGVFGVWMGQSLKLG